MEKNLGFVQIPLERYDELILDNKRMMEELDSVVKIETDWNDEPRLKIDLSKLAARLSERFEQSEFVGKWTMNDMSDHRETVWGVFKAIPQEAVEEDEDQA